MASQGGLTLIDHDAEFVATNPGIHTVTVFVVHGTWFARVQQISSRGVVPDSVVAHGRLVAGLNAGASRAVAEFKLVEGRLVALTRQVRSLGLANTNPPDFVHGAGPVGYAPDGQHVVVTTKESTTSYDVVAVGRHGSLGAAPVVTPAPNAVPFAITLDSAGNLVGAAASNSSVSTYRVTRTARSRRSAPCPTGPRVCTGSRRPTGMSSVTTPPAQ